MEYKLEILSEDDFERLINTICQKILGTGVINFSKGVDGGKDGKFTGIANKYPSEKLQWSGKFVIQAKHTTIINASCSEPSFFENKSSIINKEIDKIINLKSKSEIDNYLLFTNRKLTAKTESGIVKHIQTKTGLTNIAILGIDYIAERLKENKDIVKQYKLNEYTMPFEFYEKDIQEVISFFHANINSLKNLQPITFIDKDLKNKLNNLDVSYFNNVIKKHALKYFQQIDDFLKMPKNQKFADYYEQTANELNTKIEIKREDFDNFKDIFGYLYDYIFEKNEIELRDKRLLIQVFLHHMYYNCDIGRTQ